MNTLTREIFVVLAAENYEGSDTVRAFECREDADAFAKDCRNYEATYEQTPPMDAAQEDWDKWLEDNRAWESKHPAAPLTRRDNYAVVPLQLFAPTQGADVQTFVGKWRDVIKNMPDTYAQGADARPVAYRWKGIDDDWRYSVNKLDERAEPLCATRDAAPSDTWTDDQITREWNKHIGSAQTHHEAIRTFGRAMLAAIAPMEKT